MKKTNQANTQARIEASFDAIIITIRTGQARIGTRFENTLCLRQILRLDGSTPDNSLVSNIQKEQEHEVCHNKVGLFEQYIILHGSK